MTLSAFFQAQSKTSLLGEAVVAIGFIGIIDYVTGWDVSLFLFYAFPILFTAWFGDRRLALISAVTAGIVWYIANFPNHVHGTLGTYTWAAINRQVYLLLVAIGGSAFKQQQQAMRDRIEAMARARELEQEIVRVSEREQMRIGQDLHDGLCQNLAAIDCATACLRADLEQRALPEAEFAGVIQRMLKESVVEARNLARGIFPVQMDAEGLLAAMEELVTNTNRLRQAAVSFEVSGEVKIADPQVSMHLYRIAQEALSNAVRHAKATHVDINLVRNGDSLAMTIADDGCGFARNGTKPSAGMGLRTMQYRARLMQAEFGVDTQPSRGTLVRCSIPLTYETGN